MCQRSVPVIPCRLKASINNVYKCAPAAHTCACTHRVYVMPRPPGQFSRCCWLADHTWALHRVVGFTVLWSCVSSKAQQYQLTTWAMPFSSAVVCAIHKTWVLVPPEGHVSLDMRQRTKNCDAPKERKRHRVNATYPHSAVSKQAAELRGNQKSL